MARVHESVLVQWKVVGNAWDLPSRIHQVDPMAQGEGVGARQTRPTNSTARPIWGIQHVGRVHESVLVQCKVVGDLMDQPSRIHQVDPSATGRQRLLFLSPCNHSTCMQAHCNFLPNLVQH